MSISCSEIQTRNETINISFHSLLFLFFGLYLVEKRRETKQRKKTKTANSKKYSRNLPKGMSANSCISKSGQSFKRALGSFALMQSAILITRTLTTTKFKIKTSMCDFYTYI